MKIILQDGIYYFSAEDGAEICYVAQDRMTTKGRKMIDKATDKQLSSADFFEKLAEEQEGAFRHIYNAAKYLRQNGQTLYDICYDTGRHPAMATKQEEYLASLNIQEWDGLTLSQLQAVVEAGLPDPAKDIKITSKPGKIAGFSYSPSWDEVKSKLGI